MEKLIFRGVVLRQYDGRTDEGGHYVRMHMTADFSEPVREAMGWEAGTVSSGKLVPNSIPATHIILTPDEVSMRQHEINIDITSMDDFQLFFVKNEAGEKTSGEIRFIIRTPVVGCATMCENYMRYAGATAQMRVNYEVQEELPLEKPEAQPKQRQLAAANTADADPDTNCVACNNSIPLDPTDKTRHLSGALCTAYEGHDDGGPSLAPAAMVGGTHQRKRPALINERPVTVG